jgi:uncharacterized protein involved in type VI secretion and phage assembly
VFRDDCSDYEFLQMLAARNGYVLQCDGATLNFKKPDNLGAEEVSLAFGEGLREFRPALSLVGQVGEVQVGGWDRAQKRAVTGRSTAAKFASAETSFNRGYSIITSAHSARTFHITAPTPTQASADGQASAALDRMAASDLTAEGIAYGNPAIKPGGKVHITNLGSRFSGKYFVTRVRHRFSPDEAYTTEFWVGGMSSGTLASLVSPVAPAAAVAQPRTLPGLYTALVTNNKDPENQGRVKVKFPQIAEGNESNWAPVASVGAGAQRGLFVLPEVNDEVLVGFLHGDINYPVVLAGLWNGKDKPPDTTPTASTVDVRTFKSRKGHFLRITDEDGKEKIEVTDKSAKNHFTIDITKKSIAIMAEQDVTIEAKGDVKIKGTNVKIEGTAKVDANGPVFQAEGKTQLVLKGAAAELTATGQAKISGGMVMIN